MDYYKKYKKYKNKYLVLLGGSLYKNGDTVITNHGNTIIIKDILKPDIDGSHYHRMEFSSLPTRYIITSDKHVTDPDISTHDGKLVIFEDSIKEKVITESDRLKEEQRIHEFEAYMLHEKEMDERKEKEKEKEKQKSREFEAYMLHEKEMDERKEKAKIERYKRLAKDRYQYDIEVAKTPEEKAQVKELIEQTVLQYIEDGKKFNRTPSLNYSDLTPY